MEAAGVLSVAFGLGLLLHASQSAFFTAINGHIKTLFLHRRRLVLLSFLLCVSIFSITQFATLLLLEDASCGVAVRFTLFFDQAARVSALALIVWKVCDEAGVRTETVVWMSIIGLRILMGGIIVGFTGMTFMPVCFPEPIHIVVGIIHTAFDGFVWVALGWRIVQIWMLFVDQGRRANGSGKSQGYGLFLIVLGFVGWTIASFPYMMGVGDSIFVRMIPYILTLALSLGVLSCFPSIVFSVPIGKTDGSYKLRQFNTTSPPRRERAVSSPTFNPADMEANKFPTYAMGSFDKNYSSVRNSQMFRSILGAPIVHPGTALPWSLNTETPDITRPKPAKAPENRRPSGASHAGKASISGPIGPIVRNSGPETADATAEGQVQTSNPFGKMKTVDLKTAAEAERQRIDATFEREQGKKKLPDVVAPEVGTPSTARSISIKRKPVIPQLPSGPAAYRVSAISELRGGVSNTRPGLGRSASAGGAEGSGLGGSSLGGSGLGRSASAAGAEGSDWGMRNIARTNSILTEDDDSTTHYTSVSHAPYTLAPGPPRIPQLGGIEGGAKVMFVNQIVYDDPALVRSIIGKKDVALTTSRYSHFIGTTLRRSPSSITKKLAGMLTPTGEVDEPVTTTSPVLVMDRPRNVKSERERGIFPPNRDSGMVAEMRYKRKHLTMAIEKASNTVAIPTNLRLSLPGQNVIKDELSREFVFPMPLSRAPSARKTAPPPITIVPAMIFSPEITQHAPTPDLVDTPEQVPSVERAVSDKPVKRRMPSPSEQQSVDKSISYEKAKAWIDSVSGVAQIERSPNTPEPLVSIPYGTLSGTKARMSLISLTLSPKAKEDEGEFTDIDIDSGSESGEYEDEDEDSDEQAPSEADDMIMSGGEGYSTEEEEEEDYFTESDEERRYAIDGVVISDVEDGTTYDKIAVAERKLNAKMNSLTAENLGDQNHFQIGDRIPTFSKSRRKYGNRRKPPPSPIAFLMRQRHESQIQARLLMFSGGQNLAPLDSLMDRLPTRSKRDTQVSYVSDGRNSLIARLEKEVGQQESQWMGMHQNLDSKRSSAMSSTDSPSQKLARLSQNLSQRRSLLAKLNSGIDRRLSNAQAANMTSSSLSGAPSGRQELVEAQMEYLALAPSFQGEVGEIPFGSTSILESQHTPISVISESELDHSMIESPVGIDEVQRESFYRNDNSSVVLEGEDEDFENYEVEEYEDEEEEEEKEYAEDGIQITIYSPSIRSASIQESPVQVQYSTTEAPKSAVSLLWNPRTSEETTSETNQLWVHRPLSPESTFVFPPAVDLRPKQRISAVPITKATSHLWSKPRHIRYAPSAGLWRSPKELRPKSIIVSSSPAGRTRNSAKRVTFVEEVVTVGATGSLGKFKTFWDVLKKGSQSVAPTVPPLPKLLITKRGHFDPIVVKYANKMLPPLPTRKDEVNTRDIALWTKEENIVRNHSNAPLWTPTPTVPTLEEKIIFVKDTLEIPTKPRIAALPVLESQRLWDTGKPAVFTTLWTKPSDETYLWPTGLSPAPTSGDRLWPSAAPLPFRIELGPHSSQSYKEVALAPLESTELWKAVVELQAEEVTGLWLDKSAHFHFQEPVATPTFDSFLWPSAASLPASYSVADILSVRYSRPSTPASLKSCELWKPLMVATTTTLWSPRAKNSALWPQGQLPRAAPAVLRSLWPTAASLPFDIELDLHGSSSYRKSVALVSLESTELWKPVTVEIQTEQVAGLWFDKSAHAQFQCIEEFVATRTSDSLLWPNAASLPVPYPTVDASPIQYGRLSIANTLPTLTSRELWQPFMVAAVEKLWSLPTKRSALWPQGQLLRAAPAILKNLWPSAISLPLTIESRLHFSSSYRETVALAPLESTELWKAVVVEIQTEEVAGLWLDRSVRAQCIEEPVTIRASGSLLWPATASLPAPYPVMSIRHIRPSTTGLEALTSHKLWRPWAAATTAALWSPPTNGSTLWPQGQILRAVPGALWPAAAPLSSEVELGLYSSRSHKETAPLVLESTELWKAAAIELQAEEWTGLWFDKSTYAQSQNVQDPVATCTPGPFLWPAAASLPLYATAGTAISVRYTRPATAGLAVLTSCELWTPLMVATTTSLWSPPVKMSALWPQGQLSKALATPGELWPSAAALRLDTEVSAVRSRSLTVTLPGLQSTALWNHCQRPAGENGVPALWTAPESRSGLWPEGEVREKVIGNLWPAAPPIPVASRAFREAPARSKAKPVVLAELESSGLWKLVGIQQAATTSVIVEDSIMKLIQEEQLVDSMLWVKKQDEPIVAFGYLWPSAASFPVSYLPSTTIPSRFAAATLPILQTTQLWSSKIPIQATLWSRSTKMDCLWPHGKSNKAGSLWPLAPSLSVSTLARPMPATRPRNTAASAPQIQSLALWSPERETKARLWAAPAIENGLWPLGKSAAPANLWPSAASLPTVSCQEVRNFRTETVTLPSLESDRLWGAGSKGPVRPQLWVPEVKATGLWPRGEIVKAVIMGDLWPAASVLPKTDVITVAHSRSPPAALAELKSGELWISCIINPALWTQSTTTESGLWPNGMVCTPTSENGLWCVPDSRVIARRPNLVLRMTGDEDRMVRKKEISSAVEAVSGALWSRAEGRQTESSGWLLRTQDIESIASPPIASLIESEVGIESQSTIIASVKPSLWVKSSPPVSDIRFASALWQPKAANTASPIEGPRVRLEVERKKFRPDTSRLPPALGTLWSPSILPEARQGTWRQAPQEGLWNFDGTTEILSQIHARSQKKCSLWNKHGRQVFAHLSLASRYSKRKVSPTGSKSATGPLWAPTAPGGSGAKHPVLRSVWPIRSLAAITPRPTHLLLWQKHDKPLLLVTPAPIPASPVPSRSQEVNKRTPPLFLASQQAPGQIRTASKSPRPRELWRPLPKSGTKKILPFSSQNSTPTLKESATSSETKLWSILGSPANLFSSDISTQSIRTTRTTQQPFATISISMEGSLWSSSTVTVPAKPKLWRKKEEPAVGLWSVNGITMTPPPPVSETTTHLWGKTPGTTEPIFAGLSLESLRSRREFATKSFSAPPDGLWRKKMSEPVIERPSTGLWAMSEAAQITPVVPVKSIQLWQKDSMAAPMFANLPVESYRPKREPPTVALPVFSGSMWKKEVALPTKPQMWKSEPKSTHLWDSDSRTKSLARILLEKANTIKKPLWTKDQASRTTEKTPQRSPLATFRISNDITLPKASGNLWGTKTAKKQISQLWTPPKPVVKAPKPAGTFLWANGHTSRTTEAVPERTKVAYRPSDDPLPIMTGSLWKPTSTVKKTSLWKRVIKTVATYPRTSVAAPLWSKELASRTTNARPERSTFVPKKKEVTIILPKASGSLWQPKTAAPLNELWKVSAKPVILKPLETSPLWSKHSASRTTTAIPVRTTIPKRVVDSPLAVVSGTLWHQKAAEGPKGLWKRPIKTVATFRQTSAPALLWSKELASRTTTARPSRGPFVPKSISKSHILPAATGELWQPEPATTQPLALWTHITTSPGSGLWDAEGRTPSLVEIKRRLGAQRDPLWQRRSILTSKVTPTTIKAPAPVQKKLRINSRPVSPADGTLWQPVTPVLADSVAMWLTRSSRSSSIDEEFASPILSRASTISDMSECEDSPPSTGADDFAPGIARTHSTKASISSVAGDLLWQRTAEIVAARKKELALWGGEEPSLGKSASVAERPMRIPLPDRAREMKVFDKSHELWKPSGEVDEKEQSLYDSSSSDGDFHDAESHDAEFEFHDAESQHSEETQYQDFDYAEGKRRTSTSAEEEVKPFAGCLWSRCAA